LLTNREQAQAWLESRITWFFHRYRGVKKQQIIAASPQLAGGKKFDGTVVTNWRQTDSVV
jgi:hypothetical protein